MSDSGDCSDAEMNQPSCSKKTVQKNGHEKRNRRIIMQIEFKDSDDTDDDDTCSVSSNENDISISNHMNAGTDLGGSSVSQASCSNRSQHVNHNNHSIGSAIISCQHNKRRNESNCEKNCEDDGNITKKHKPGKRRRNECEKATVQKILTDAQSDLDVGFSSDSSSNDLLEKCPICLLTFRQQQIGRPVTCEHIFCASCIEAWANNVQTCPIDRCVFDKIIVLSSCKRRNVVREIRVDLNQSKTELRIDDENDEVSTNNVDDEFTNCEICNCSDREEIMLLCDSCNNGYHMDCLDPPLFEIPAGSWYCDNCIDSEYDGEDEDLELAEDLHTLYEDIRGMGLPESRLRVRPVQQPRILRTRQNERIRAAVLRHTQPNAGGQSVVRSQLGFTTTQTTARHTRNIISGRSTRTATKHKIKSRKLRSRKSRHRTYVVEYDLNNFDEKFAIKTRKKVIRRRRKRKLTRQNKSKNAAISNSQMTASKRLAEQLGVKIEGFRRSHLSGGNASTFTLFGNPNDLEYFSDTEETRNDSGGEINNEYIASTAVQTIIRNPNVGVPRNRKALLLGKTRIATPIHTSTSAATSDILSSIMELQDLWYNASRNLGAVHINADGSLSLPQRTSARNIKTISTPGGIQKPTEHITQVPLYQRGGSGPNLGQSGSGSYSNRYSDSNSRTSGPGNNSSTGAANQYQHHSTGAMPNNNDNMSTESSFGNQNNNNNSISTTNLIPLNTHSTSTNQQRNQNIQQSRQLSYVSGVRMPLTGTATPSTSFADVIPQQQERFSGLATQINAPELEARISMPPVITVPPPPAPPPSLSWNSSLFKLKTDYGKETGSKKSHDNDDDENCPNFSIYSQESQSVATELFAHPEKATTNLDQDDEKMNEDLVQLDDDEDIPLPPESETNIVGAGNEHCIACDDLYEPETPTEVQDGNEKEIKNKPRQTDNVDECKANLRKNNSDCETGTSTTEPVKDRDNKDERRMLNTPSPLIKDTPTNDRGKSVLELYDDSDWEELEIEKPKQYEKALKKGTLSNVQDCGKSKTPADEISAKSSSNEPDQDRSYTPCLDEKNVDEDNTAINQKDKLEISCSDKKNDKRASELTEKDNQRMTGMSTELISEDEELPLANNLKRRSRSRHRIEDDSKVDKSKRSIRRGKETSETFKKVGKRQKDRNYRSDKHHQHNRSNSRRSNSNTLHSASNSCSNPGHSRSRSHSRSLRHRRRNTRSNSYSRSKSRSHSPNGSRLHSTHRSREQVRRVGRGRGGLRYSYRNQQRSYQQHLQPTQYQHHHHQHQGQNQYQTQQPLQRIKRRELPRYDVRNVVSASRHHQKDRYGRDANRSARSRSFSDERRQHLRSYSRSSSNSRSHCMSPKRLRSFSISPSPPLGAARHQHEQGIRRRSVSSRRRFEHSPSISQPLEATHRSSPLQRSSSTMSLLSRSNTPTRINGNRNLQTKKNSPCFSPRYTPRLSRSPSKGSRKKKKKKSDKKKKAKKRPSSISPMGHQRRLSRQRDTHNDVDDFLAPQLGKKAKKSTTGLPAIHWSPSPTPSLSTEPLNFIHSGGTGVNSEKPASWTPPLVSPQAPVTHFTENPHIDLTPGMVKKVKPKRDKAKKKKKLIEKQRKDKKRKRHTVTPEPLPSKEVFASGNNILVSVSFNKEANASTQIGSVQQQTVVTLQPTRDEFLGVHRSSTDRLTNSSTITTKKNKRKRKKIDAKPVAIIDLERSPFQVHQEPTDIIVLTDSEDATENQILLRRERRLNSLTSVGDIDMIRENVQSEKATPSCLEPILETFEKTPQTTGPKTPPEPHLVKFNLPAKKLNKVRNNPLHDDADDIQSADELDTVCSIRGSINDESQQPRANEGLLSTQKIGPNTPPESGPCSPDVYDPFEPTKSPSLSPRSPTPTPTQSLEPMLKTPTTVSISSCGGADKNDAGVQIHKNHNEDIVDMNIGTPTLLNSTNLTAQTNTNINPVDLVMALMNKPSNSVQQDIANKSSDVSTASYHNSTTMSSAVPCAEDKLADNTVTVLSNVLLTSNTALSASQHIPVISSPPTSMVRKLATLPKAGSSVGSSNSGIVNPPSGSGVIRNGNNGPAMDDSLNMDIESPYSPGSADYEDLFEPPSEGGNAPCSNRRLKCTTVSSSTGKAEMFDNLFGSTSPVGQHRTSVRYNVAEGRKQQRPHNKNERKSKIKANKIGEDHTKVYDVPNSAVDLQVKDKFIRKLNRQERVVEEVKLVLKPHFNKKVITKDDYKDIMRRAVPKICHSRSGEINPHKIKNLIDAYVKKFRAKHKKLNLINTGQVSSAVKCAAYLKKL